MKNKIKKSVGLIASNTERSLIYLSKITFNKIQLQHVYILSNKKKLLPGQKSTISVNLKKLIDICVANNIKYSIYDSDVNDLKFQLEMKKTSLDLMIYSGFGGVIISDSLLQVSPPILHIHSGHLPYYRGSTTIFYSILRDNCCGATGIILNAGIDTGDIVGIQKFPIPRVDEDVDFAYDTKIRSHLLIKLLEEFFKYGCFPNTKKQSKYDGVNHYIAHPVIRYLSIQGKWRKSL